MSVRFSFARKNRSERSAADDNSVTGGLVPFRCRVNGMSNALRLQFGGSLDA